MRKFLLGIISYGLLLACNSNKSAEQANSNTDTTKMESGTISKDIEFADDKYKEMGNSDVRKFESKDIDSWVNSFAETAVYLWSSGDSLVGKKAIADYWNNRMKNVIDTIKLSNEIWLPIKINKPQKGPDLPGIWLLGWRQVDAKYKTGKKLMFWIHTDYHYDKDDKIDRFIEYIDRAPIIAATKK